MKKIATDKFCVKKKGRIKLSGWPTKVRPFYPSKEAYQEKMAAQVRKLSELQNLLFAHDRYALLIIFQAMDAAGKDSVIKHVMSGLNPQGCQVFSFKHPSAEELDHDFLWRTTRALPERGRIGIFNRSYYEEVLIVRVHPEILQAQKLPPGSAKNIWKERFRSIMEMEEHLFRSGTRVIKFFLHCSKDEQRRRFLKRIEDPRKNWKFSVDDLKEREYWGRYMKAYEACLGATSSAHSPWYVVPADDKHNAQLIISQVILEALEGLKMSYPSVSATRRRELQKIRRELEDR